MRTRIEDEETRKALLETRQAYYKKPDEFAERLRSLNQRLNPERPGEQKAMADQERQHRNGRS